MDKTMRQLFAGASAGISGCIAGYAFTNGSIGIAMASGVSAVLALVLAVDAN